MNFFPSKMTYFNMSAFVTFGLPKIVKIFRELNIKKSASRADFKRIILKPKLQLIFLALGILVFRYFIGHFIVKRQKTIKDEMCENQPKDFDENDEDLEKYMDLGPDDSLSKPSKYDPSIDYYDLVWKAYYKKHKGEPFAESTKRLIESFDSKNDGD